MIDDINDLMLEVQAEFAEIVRELFEDLAQPQVKNMLAMQFAQMHPDEKELIRRQSPEQYAKLERMLAK